MGPDIWEASGQLIGGNLSTLSLLQGTEHMPGLDGSVLFLEDDYLSFPENFDRQLTSLSHQPGFEGVRGVLIGRFQAEVGMTRSKLQHIIDSNRRLAELPIIANLDFGHSDPILTIPLGVKPGWPPHPSSACWRSSSGRGRLLPGCTKGLKGGRRRAVGMLAMVPCWPDGDE